jgi:hypothetical protein
MRWKRCLRAPPDRIPEPLVQVGKVKLKLGRPNARAMHAVQFYSSPVAQRALVQGNIGSGACPQTKLILEQLTVFG